MHQFVIFQVLCVYKHKVSRLYLPVFSELYHRAFASDTLFKDCFVPLVLKLNVLVVCFSVNS